MYKIRVYKDGLQITEYQISGNIHSAAFHADLIRSCGYVVTVDAIK